MRENHMGGGIAWVADGWTKDNAAPKVVHFLVFLVVCNVYRRNEKTSRLWTHYFLAKYVDQLHIQYIPRYGACMHGNRTLQRGVFAPASCSLYAMRPPPPVA